MYFIQGIMSGTVILETTLDDETAAIDMAKEIVSNPTFEGTCVRVLDIDSCLVFKRYVL